MLKSFNIFFKSAIITLIFLGALTTEIQAQSQQNPISNLSLNTSTRILSGDISGQSASQLNFYFQNSNNQNSLIETISWETGSFELSVSDFIFNGTTATKDGVNYDSIALLVTGGSTYIYSLGQIINNTSSVIVNFPGWQFIPDDQAILPIPNNPGKYYPVLRSNQTVNGDITTTRSPSSAPLILVIRNTNTNLPDAQRYGALKLFPGGPGSFNVNFPDCFGNNCQLTPASELEPGQSYEIFLSDNYVEGGSGTPVNVGGSISTLKSLPPIPQATEDNQNQIVSGINVIPKQQGSKRYYEISGTITAANPAPAPGTALNFVIREPGASSGQVLAQIPFTAGPFSIPNNQQLQNFASLATGEYELSINSNIDNLEVQNPIQLPNMTANPSGSSPTDSSDTQIFTNEQVQLLSGGIVPSCGYFINSDLKDAAGNTITDSAGNPVKGKVCGFSDLITLVQKVIEYIFILTVPITAIVFAYAGYLFLTSGENSNKRKDAKNAMIKVVIGIAVVMSAWLIVTLIVTTLGASSATTQFLDI